MARSTRSASACRRIRTAAFTLVEMSVVLIVIGLVILVVFPALQALRVSSQQSATRTNLESLIRATAAFVQANGCVPCPTPAGTGIAGFGRLRGDTATVPCSGCAVPEGIAPFIALGLPANTARDGWGRWITMRVDPDLTINFGVVPPTAACTASDPFPCTLGASQKGLCRANLPTTNRVVVRGPGNSPFQDAAILFLSHGANGYGAYRANPLNPPGSNIHPTFSGPSAPCSTNGGFELCNANNDPLFTIASNSNNPASFFDDVATYMGRNALVSLLGNGACQTSWE